MSELPRKGDKVFIQSTNERYPAPVSVSSLDERSYYLFHGFKKAAEIVVSHLAAGEDSRHAERLIYPIVFLYRHALELCLKRVIEFGSKIVEKGKANEVLASHSLIILWRETRKILDAVGAGENPEIAAFETCINQLNSVDPTSQSFRYASTKAGDALLPPKMRTIDLENFYEVMNRLFSLLDAADFLIGRAIDDRSEMLDAYADLADC